MSSLDLETMTGDRALQSKFDVGDVGTEALLFQSGYLTIQGSSGMPAAGAATAWATRTKRCARA
ncbi:MAG: hypothetical protein OXF93_16765 [Acidobacteria bacterium]|nr:hypothetical protein [Acidobacteriota bacterium]